MVSPLRQQSPLEIQDLVRLEGCSCSKGMSRGRDSKLLHRARVQLISKLQVASTVDTTNQVHEVNDQNPPLPAGGWGRIILPGVGLFLRDPRCSNYCT
jgi:hypothetical protein